MQALEIMNKLGSEPVSKVLPALKIIAIQNNLNLKFWTDWKKALKILGNHPNKDFILTYLNFSNTEKNVS